MATLVNYDAVKMQPVLFNAPVMTNGFRDPSFAKNKTLPLHRWVPWVAGFSAEFVQDCLQIYLQNPSTKSWVLDPFAGVGTTLVESYVSGLNVMGFEINPYAALATQLKLQSAQVPLVQMIREIERFERFMRRTETGSLKSEPHSLPPEGFRGRTQLFSPSVERKVLYALDLIHRMEDPTLKDIFRLGFGSVMVGFSNYSYEPSLTRRAAVNKPNIVDANVGLEISAKLRLMAQDIEWLQARMKCFEHDPDRKVIPQTIFSASTLVDQCDFVDLVVTSPPYLNNYHYPRNTRPQLHWLGFTSGTGYSGAREGESFGKFWQTVRESDPIHLSFNMPDLSETIESIRKKNADRGAYGGPGWANYVATYFNDCYRFCSLLARLLKRNAPAIIVLGNSIIQGVEVKTDQVFGQIGALAGLSFEDTHLLRKKRTGSSIIQSSIRADRPAKKAALYESAIVLRRLE